jgi:hypothetical protein
MRERVIALLLACAALLAFYGLILRPQSSFGPDADAPRPTTTERRGNGYSAAFDWLERSGVRARSLRERYTALADLELPARGNLLLLSLPAVEGFSNEEFAPLDQWVRRGNTLLLVAALVDAPGWAGARQARAVAEIETLTSLEFETRAAREARLDETPLAERVRRADARKDDAADHKNDKSAAGITAGPSDQRIAGHWLAVGPHALTRGVRRLATESDYSPEDWSLRLPYDSFLLTLARDEKTGEGVMFEQRVGAGRIVLLAGGSPFTNRALGEADNSQLFANIVTTSVAPGGAVLFDDLRQGLSASYDPSRFYSDPRLYKTIAMLLGLWLVWVLGSTRLRAPAIVAHDPSEAALVRRTGGFMARVVAPHHTAVALFENFFAAVARVARGSGRILAEREALWSWLERNAAILPQDLDRLKAWYADAYSERKVPLVQLQNLLDSMGKRLGI